MLWIGVVLVILGGLWSAFKGRMVWKVAHDVYNGGGVPTLDFPLFCPIPVAAGLSTLLSAMNALPFPGFGFAIYLGLAITFWALLIWFYRIGEPERQRQLAAVQQRTSRE
jgi:hypothetical protein